MSWPDLIAVELLSGQSLASCGVIIWAKFDFEEAVCIEKHYKTSSFGTFLKKRCGKLSCWYLHLQCQSIRSSNLQRRARCGISGHHHLGRRESRFLARRDLNHT